MANIKLVKSLEKEYIKEGKKLNTKNDNTRRL